MASIGCSSLTTDDVLRLDARGLKCPLTVLKTEKLLAGLAAGTEILVLATDPMAKVDIPLYCQRQGHACSVAVAGEELHFSIRKAG